MVINLDVSLNLDKSGGGVTFILSISSAGGILLHSYSCLYDGITFSSTCLAI